MRISCPTSTLQYPPSNLTRAKAFQLFELPAISSATASCLVLWLGHGDVFDEAATTPISNSFLKLVELILKRSSWYLNSVSLSQQSDLQMPPQFLKVKIQR